MISDEAIQAAAEVLYKRDRALLVPWGDTALPDIRAYRDEARAALEAAAPYLMAEAWDEGRGAGFRDAYADEAEEEPNPYRSQA